MKKIIYVKGMSVAVWEQSFKVDGMSRAVFVGPHMDELMIRQMIEAIYRHIEQCALLEARDRFLGAHTRQLDKLYDDILEDALTTDP